MFILALLQMGVLCHLEYQYEYRYRTLLYEYYVHYLPVMQLKYYEYSYCTYCQYEYCTVYLMFTNK